MNKLVEWSADEIAMDKVDKAEKERKKYLATKGIKSKVKDLK